MSSPEDLKAQMLQSMRRLASSVSIISSGNGSERHAMAATSVTSLSMDPPSLLVCVNQSTAMHGALDDGADFCVNVLSRDQEEVSVVCGGKVKGEERFNTGKWQTSKQGLPYLADSQSVLVCEQDGRYSYGTHTIFIGRIKEIRNSADVSPLIYVDGRYTTSVEAAVEA